MSIRASSKRLEPANRLRVFTLDDGVKSGADRSQRVFEWHENGGVLIMGYEMFRLLTDDGSERKRRSVKREASSAPAPAPLPPPPSSASSSLPMLPGLPAADGGAVDEDRGEKDGKVPLREVLLEGPDLIICDEGHRIKNKDAGTSVLLKKVKTSRRVVLTG